MCLVDVLEELRIEDDFAYEIRDETILCGFHLDSSAYEKDAVRLRVFVQPLFVRCEFLVLDCSQVLGPSSFLCVPAGTELEMARVMFNAMHKAWRSYLKLARNTAEFVKNQRKLCPGRMRAHFLEARCLALFLLGDLEGAQLVGKEWRAAVDVDFSSSSLLDRKRHECERVLGALRAGHGAAMQLVQEDIAFTRAALRI